MTLTSSWQCLGGPGTWTYRWFDAERQRLNRRLVRTLVRHAGLPLQARVLEAGSGPGYASSLFARQSGVALSVAADLDPSALQEARRRDPLLPTAAADLYQLPFTDGAFDLVWNSSTLEHLAAPAEALREMARVTKPGGCIFVGVPYRFGPFGFQPWIHATPLGVWIGSVFDKDALARLVREAGLAPATVMTYYGRSFLGMLARKPRQAASAAAPTPAMIGAAS